MTIDVPRRKFARASEPAKRFRALKRAGGLGSVDLCFAAEGSESLQQRVACLNGLHTLEHAEEIGLGSRTYELVNIDD